MPPVIAKMQRRRRRTNLQRSRKNRQNLPDSVADGKTTTETAGTGKAEDAPVTDVKEWHKKVASVKKKKSSKEMDAAARSARLAVAKFLFVSCLCLSFCFAHYNFRLSFIIYGHMLFVHLQMKSKHR
ncbi:hypothetical protein S83_002424 [Arachis hypogaea]|nr:uncharacterized protein DS421_1g24680 [Arachis hypogaea]